MGMRRRALQWLDARVIAGLAGGLAVAMALSAGAAERMVLGEYFTSVF